MISDANCAVWLYGSQSRGDADEFSDVDVLFVSEDGRIEEVAGGLMAEPKNLSISNYSWNEIERMSQYGSLFLHHIQLEGQPILETPRARGRLKKLLSSLGPYQLASRDLLSFRTVLNDIRISLSDGQASLYYELSILATALRHTAILGCSIGGMPCFSRNEAIGQLTDLWKLPQQWVVEFPQLYAYRLYAVCRAPRPREASSEFILTWCNRLDLILSLLENHATKKS